jgi:hypothetical protein
MKVFRDIYQGIDRSPLRSVYGVNSSNEIIIPIDLCILVATAGNMSQPDLGLPTRLSSSVTFSPQGGSPIGTLIVPVNLPSAVKDVDPIVKLKNLGTISFTPIKPALLSELLPNEQIIVITSNQRIISGQLINNQVSSGLVYLTGLNTVEAFKISVNGNLNLSEIGSMVMVPRLNKSLGMYLGFSSGTSIVYPAFKFF